jgi:hypothetical protein
MMMMMMMMMTTKDGYKFVNEQQANGHKESLLKPYYCPQRHLK